MAQERISFDYDGTLSTTKGYALACSLKGTGVMYIVSSRSNKDEMVRLGKKLGIPYNRIYAVGTNDDKIAKVKQLVIKTHYDNNPEVVKRLGKIGKLV